MDQEISAHLLKLRRTNPFLATISLFANYRFDQSVHLFETDGDLIRINSDYFKRLQPKQKTGVLLHITLHTALQHAARAGARNASIWNIAADIVVNNIILESGDFISPPNTAVESKYSDHSVEQVYETLTHLHNKSAAFKSAAMNVQSSECSSGKPVPTQDSSANGAKDDPNAQLDESAKNTTIKNTNSPSTSQIQTLLESLYPCHSDLKSEPSTSTEKPTTSAAKTQLYWQNAFRKAEIAERFGSKLQGDLPAGLLREIDLIMNPELDWKWLLWNFVVRTPSDFEGFDRRFIHQGLYLDQLESNRLNVLVAVDTSASIEQHELTQFLSELTSIIHIYHFIQVELYYVDADIYGPFELSSSDQLDPPIGGGGTDFSVFYEKVVENYEGDSLDVIVYFTDGYGEFPANSSPVDTLWIVTSGGLESELFPFGQVARLAR